MNSIHTRLSSAGRIYFPSSCGEFCRIVAIYCVGGSPQPSPCWILSYLRVKWWTVEFTEFTLRLSFLWAERIQLTWSSLVPRHVERGHERSFESPVMSRLLNPQAMDDEAAAEAVKYVRCDRSDWGCSWDQQRWSRIDWASRNAMA